MSGLQRRLRRLEGLASFSGAGVEEAVRREALRRTSTTDLEALETAIARAEERAPGVFAEEDLPLIRRCEELIEEVRDELTD